MIHLRRPLVLTARRATRRSASRLAAAAAAWLVCGAAAYPQGAPKVLGAQDCEKCHKAALKKWKTEEPAQQGPKAHAVTHKQLADPKAAKFAAAIGLADPADLKGRCVECHATVVRGLVRSGVSCESCHGPASLYNPVHDKEPLAESYKKSIPLGLRDLHARPAAIAALCVGCHVTPEPALAAAGHPSGAAFDAGASLRKLVHWTSAFTGDGSEHASYDFAQVTAAARPLVQKALAGGGARPRAAAAKPATSAADTGGRGLATAEPVARLPPAPWDWDQPVAALPDDYPSDAGAGSGAEGVAAGPRTEAGVTTPAGPSPRAVGAARRALSIAPDQPALEPPEITAPSAAIEPGLPPSGTSAAAALRAQAAELLRKLLADGRRAPDVPPARAPQEFQGPDGELLNLQDVALYLAIETLRRRPGAAAAPGPVKP